ncbi:hypothetical protein [Natrialba sp. PRR66]|nr:hypothetical protein [Natrialba sp. PRR66]
MIGQVVRDITLLVGIELPRRCEFTPEHAAVDAVDAYFELVLGGCSSMKT